MPRPGTAVVGVAAAALTAFAVGIDLHAARVGEYPRRSSTPWATTRPARTGFPVGTSPEDSVTASSSSSFSGGTFWAVLAILLLATIAILGFVTYNRRRVREPSGPVGPEESGDPDGPGWGAGAGESAAEGEPDLAEAEADAARLLIETDDAVKAGEQERAVAVTQFGRDSAAQLEATLDTAKLDLAEAFRLRAGLDDDPVPAAPERYRILREVIDKCTEANEALDAQWAAFERLRARRDRAAGK
jgi:hypothetical protein